MNHTKSGDFVYITLSERNVKQLLQAHERGYAAGLVRRTEDGTRLYVRIESDTEHYKDREAGPGLDHEVD